MRALAAVVPYDEHAVNFLNLYLVPKGQGDGGGVGLGGVMVAKSGHRKHTPSLLITTPAITKVHQQVNCFIFWKRGLFGEREREREREREIL